MVQFFSFFGGIFGYVLWFIYNIIPNFSIAIIIFTIIFKGVLFPFSIKQQKSMANNARMQKKQQEIKEKYANNKEKQNEEINALYQKEGISPTSGCLTSILPMIVMLGIFYAVAYPLTNTIHLNSDTVNQALTYVSRIPGYVSSSNTFYQQIEFLNVFPSLHDVMSNIFTSQEMTQITSLSNGFNLFGANLLATPKNEGISWYLLIPALCLISSIATQLITQKLNQTKMQGCMTVMLLAMPLFSAYIAYTVPSAVGFYWICSTCLGLVQTIIMHRFYNPVSMIAEKEARHLALMQQQEAAVEYCYVPANENNNNKNKSKKNNKKK